MLLGRVVLLELPLLELVVQALLLERQVWSELPVN